MAEWFVKDLCALTGVSVQTLHHYDRIDLLKPSLRLTNGYRVYSEKDLLKLQQIIALKFFGFELLQIKSLLTGHEGALEHLSAQALVLEQKASDLIEASKALKSLISDVKDDKSIPWEIIIQSIEVYRMTQQLEHSWVKDIFTPDELKQFAAFESEFKAHSTPEQKSAFEHNWNSLVEDVKHNLSKDPRSEIGIQLGEKCMLWVNGVYGKKYAHLRTKKFEKGFGEGKGLDDVGLTPKMVSWLEIAMDSYWQHRIYGILARVGTMSSSDVLNLWNEVLDDMYGDNAERMKTVLDDITLKDAKLGEDLKTWLQSLSKS